MTVVLAGHAYHVSSLDESLNTFFKFLQLPFTENRSYDLTIF